MSSNFGYIPAPIAPNLTDLTAESGNTARMLNYHLAGFTYPRSRASYSQEITQRTMAELLGKGYDSAGDAVDLSADVLDGVLAAKVRGVTRTNCIASPTMAVDTDSDGVVDDFMAVSDVNQTVVFTATDGYQVITVNEATDAGASAVTQTVFPAKANEVFSVAVEGRVGSVVEGFKGRLYCEWLDADDVSLDNFSVDVTATTSTVVKVENQTAPATTAKLKVSLQAVSLASGDTGVARYRKCLVEKAATAGVFIEGTQSTPPQRIKTAKKIIWGGMKAALDIISKIPDKAYLTIRDGKTCLAIQGNFTGFGGLLENCFAPNTRYTLSFRSDREDKTGGVFVLIHTDGSSVGSSVASAWGLWEITSAPGKTVARLDVGYASQNGTTYYDIDTLQLEVGTSATDEPYVESAAYTPALRATGTVADEVDFLRGEHIRRVSHTYTITGAQILSCASRYKHDTTAALELVLDVPEDTVGSSLSNDRAYIVVRGIKFASISGYGLDNTIWAVPNRYFMRETASKTVRVSLAAADTGWTEIPTLTQIQAYFDANPMTLHYEIPTPVVTKLPQQVLQAYQNGSLIAEPVLAGSQKPNSVTGKIDIDRASTWPAASIESVYRHDVQVNGQVLFTDVTASFTLTDNGTTITIADVDKTKVYSYSCLIDSRYNPGCEIVTQVPLCCARHDFSGGFATWTPTRDELNARILIPSNAGGEFDINLPDVPGDYLIVNTTDQLCNAKVSDGTDAEIAAGKIAHVAWDGAEIIVVAISA